jgi:hypothetical protein
MSLRVLKDQQRRGSLIEGRENVVPERLPIALAGLGAAAAFFARWTRA